MATLYRAGMAAGRVAAPGPSRGAKELGKELRSWCSSDESYAILDRHGLGSTWFTGGCPSLAAALGRWYGARAAYAAVVGNGGVRQHYMADVAGWLLDGDGASSRDAALRRWSARERIESPRIEPLGHELSDAHFEGDDSGMSCPAEAVAEIAGALARALGPPDAYDLEGRPAPFRTTSSTVSSLYRYIARVGPQPEDVVLATLAALRDAKACAEAFGATGSVEGYDVLDAALDAIEREPQGSLSGDRGRLFDQLSDMEREARRRAKGFAHLYPPLDDHELVLRVADVHARDLVAYLLLRAALSAASAAWTRSDNGLYFAASRCASVISRCDGEGRREAEARVVAAVARSMGEPRRRRNPPRDPGVFVALRPDGPAAARIAAARGVDAGDLHLTLAFLGKASSLPPGFTERAAAAVARAAEGRPRIDAVAGKARMFPASGGQRVRYLPVSGAGLRPLREAVVRELEEELLEVDATFGFTPHITVGRSPDGGPPPEPGSPVRVSFGEVWVCVGREMIPAAELRRSGRDRGRKGSGR